MSVGVIPAPVSRASGRRPDARGVAAESASSRSMRGGGEERPPTVVDPRPLSCPDVAEPDANMDEVDDRAEVVEVRDGVWRRWASA